MSNPAKEESFDELVDAVLRVVSRFSSHCKERGEDEMMYAANRSWYELTRARDKRDHVDVSDLPSQVKNGEK